MLQVLMVTPRFIKGGIEKLLLDIFENYNSDEIQYSIFVCCGECDDDYLNCLNRLGIKTFIGSPSRGIIGEKVLCRVALYNHLKTHKYDVIHINQSSLRRIVDLWIAKKNGISVRILHAHGCMGTRKKFVIKQILHDLVKDYLLDFYATDYIACSKDAADGLFPKKVIQNNKYYLLKNGVCIDRYKYSDSDRSRVRSKLGVSEETLVIGNVGRLSYEKNQGYLLKIIEAVKDKISVLLVIVGMGEMYDDLKSTIIQKRLDREVLLYGDTSEVGPLLSAMDVFLFPSLSEGFGLAALEAQCNGLPIIMGNHLPIEVCINSNIVRLPLDDMDLWIDNICHMNLIRMHETNEIENKGFDIRFVANQLEEYYKQMIEEKDGN